MENKKKRTITKKERSMKKLSGRIIKLMDYYGYDVNNCHSIPNLVKAMESKGIAISNGYKTIRSHIMDEVNELDMQWLKNYCDFFECSADYLLGKIDSFTYDDELLKSRSQSKLSDSAIKKLLDDKEKSLVINSLLETNGIDYIIQALHFYTKYVHANNYIFNQLDNNIPGITQSDLDVFYSNLKAGNESQKDIMASVCFDNILRDKALKEYLENYAFDDFSEKLTADITKQVNSAINQK